MTSETELIAAAQGGDRGALESLFSRFDERIERYARMMLGDAAAALDLKQEVFERVLTHLHQLKDTSRFSSWLFSIAINRCREHLRQSIQRDHPQNARELEHDPAAVRASALSSLMRRESADLLAVAIDRLPVLLREAFVLHHVEQVPYAEIARMTDASEATLHVRSHRAKALLRQQLGGVVDTFWSEKP